MQREYCPQCGEIMVKETSLYYLNKVNTLCYSCYHWYVSKEYKDIEEAKKICADYWFLVFKQKPVTTVELKEKLRRKKKIRTTVTVEPEPEPEPEKEKEKEKSNKE